jgi:hypothetical protein
MYTAAGTGAWTGTTFKVCFGDLFKDSDGDLLRDSDEPLLRQCENMPLGDYSIYIKAVYYQDIDNSGTYSQGDNINSVASSDSQVFSTVEEPALYLITPEETEVSHYCPDGHLVTKVINIYGWGFGEDQGNSKVYIGTGAMWANDGGYELKRTLWSDLLIKAAVDVPAPEGNPILGNEYYIWVDKEPGTSYPDTRDKTDGRYGYPGLYLLPAHTCP